MGHPLRAELTHRCSPQQHWLGKTPLATNPHSQDSVRPSLGPSLGLFEPVFFLERSNLPGCACRISRGSSFHQPRQMPFGSLVHSDDCGLHSHFAPDRLVPEARGLPQILWSKGSSQDFGAEGRPSSFSLPGPHALHFVSLEKLCSPDCLSQISSGLHSTSLCWDTVAPETKPTTAFNRILPQISQSHRGPGFSQIVCISIVTSTTQPSRVREMGTS